MPQVHDGGSGSREGVGASVRHRRLPNGSEVRELRVSVSVWPFLPNRCIRHRYALASTGAELTEAALRTFVQSWADGKATPSYKSEPAPVEEADALVRKVVQKTFAAEVEGASGDVLLELHTDWSAKHKELLPRLEVLSKVLRGVKSTVSIARMDSTKNAELKEMHGESWKYDKYGEFALFYVRKGQVASPAAFDTTKGESTPTVLKLLEFVHEHSSEPKFDLAAAKQALEALEAAQLKEEVCVIVRCGLHAACCTLYAGCCMLAACLH
jgi:hypothetical protein